MAKLGINLHEVEVKSFEPVPDGRYLARITSVDIKQKDESSAPYLEVQLEITEDGAYVNRRLWHYASTSKDGQFRVKQLFDAAGVEYGEDCDTDDLLGAEVVVAVAVESYQGKLRNKVTDVFSVE